MRLSAKFLTNDCFIPQTSIPKTLCFDKIVLWTIRLSKSSMDKDPVFTINVIVDLSLSEEFFLSTSDLLKQDRHEEAIAEFFKAIDIDRTGVLDQNEVEITYWRVQTMH